MRVALFVTCLVDGLFPDVGKATVALLERLGCTVEVPLAQTCCGQMHINTGYLREAAPLVRAGLTQRPWSWPLQIVTAVVALGAIGALWRRRFYLARVLAVGQVALILGGWALSLYPFLVPPDISIIQAVAPLSVLRPVLWGTALGLLILVPSFLYLFRVFKGGTAFSQTDEK
mgnify:CR=1 FL=1